MSIFPKNTWYVAATSDEVPADKPFGRQICNERVVLYRAQEGRIAAVEDFCGQAAAHLREVGLSRASGDWLWEHGPQILRNVQEPALLRMDMLQG